MNHRIFVIIILRQRALLFFVFIVIFVIVTNITEKISENAIKM